MSLAKIVVSMLLLTLLFLTRFSPVLAQETPGETPEYVPNQVLVRYTDEAKALLPNSPEPVPTSSQSSWINRLLAWFGISKNAGPSGTSALIESYQTLKDTIGITDQTALATNTSGTPNTIKFGQIPVSPSVNSPQNDGLANVYLVTFNKTTVKDAIARYKTSGLVSQVQANFIYQALETTPNDPRYSEQWALPKMALPHAWDKTTGSDSVVVAVVDTGVDYNHKDIKDNMWTGDVGNGLGHGRDFVQNDNDPMDENGHGTHVAGSIGAVANNGVGIAGINWKVKIMAVRVLSAAGSGSTDQIVRGIGFASTHGARVINMSLGGQDDCRTDVTAPTANPIGNDALAAATRNGTLVVVAAGNSHANAACFWPANDPNVLTVSATGPSDERAVYSNYGMAAWKGVKIVAAPGGNVSGGSSNCTVPLCILSTWPNDAYRAIEGTSMASPQVAGVAALVLSQKNLSPLALRQLLASTGDDVVKNADFTVSPNSSIRGDDGKRSMGKRINAYRALTESSGDGTNPSPTPAGPTPTIDPNAPTATPQPPTSTPPPERTGGVAIWIQDSGGNIVPTGSKLTKGTPVGIHYSRVAGALTLTIDRGPGLVKAYTADCIPNNSRYDRFCHDNPDGYIGSAENNLMPLGNLASTDGSPHVYSLENGGQKVSATIYVTTP